MIDTKALRSRILDLAIQGKLTQHLDSDGTAEELYQQIQAEKQRLIKEGKIKKEKPLSEISADEIPFEIPNHWKSVRFGTIINLQSGQDLTKQEYSDNECGIPYITGASNFNSDGTLIINRWTNAPKAFAEKGDILISCKGTVGKITILNIDKVHIARQIMGIRTYCVDNEFITIFLRSVVSGIVNAQKGLIPGIERKDILNLVCLIPPLAEQKRIVERVEEIFRLLDTIDEAQEKYSADSQILKAKLITAGIQGKLTKQLPSDGTAEELYQQIQAEKQKLISEGKIKKEKPLPPIADEEIPFEIPSNWKWVRFGTIADMLSGFAFKSQDFKKAGKYRLLRGINLGVNSIRWDDTVFVDSIQEKHSAYKLECGDVILGLDRPWISAGTRVAIYNNNEETYLVQRVLRVRGNGYLLNTFIALLLNSSLLKSPIGEYTTGISVPHISPNQVGSIVVPLPPLAEQKRIAETLEKVLGAIDNK